MKPIRLFTALFLIFSVVACNKANEQASGVGDALIVVKKINNQVAYGISLYAYTYSSFKTVTVTNTGDPSKVYTLAANQGYKTNFYYETPDNEFSTTKPAAGTYLFSATFENGVAQNFSDELTADVIDLPTLTKCEYSTTNHRLEINWNLIQNANGYAVNIFDGETVVLSSTGLRDNIKAYAVSLGSGWATGYTPEANKTYKVRVLGFRYEPNGDTYNVQAVAVTDTTVVWGN